MWHSALLLPRLQPVRTVPLSQELLIEEAVAAADAVTRRAVLTALQRVGLQGEQSTPCCTPCDPMKQFGAAATGLTQRLSAVVSPTEEDNEALALVQGLAQLLAQGSPDAPPLMALPAQPLSLAQVQSLAHDLGPLLPQLLPGGAQALRRFNLALAARAAQVCCLLHWCVRCTALHCALLLGCSASGKTWNH